MKKLFLISTFLIFGLIVVAKAQSQTTRADNRERAQRTRIHEGRAGGEVTNQEAAKLNAEQRHIRRAERRAKADGQVTPLEKGRIEKKQDRASRHIRRAKNNKVQK